MTKKQKNLDRFAEHNNALLRNPLEVIQQTQFNLNIDPKLLQQKIQGRWWEILRSLKIQLLVSREYEHFVLCLDAGRNTPTTSYMPLPHPSGITIDRKNKNIFIACTRNPNQIYRFKAIQGLLDRPDMKRSKESTQQTLIPVETTFYPGSLYIHDLAFIKNRLYANAVGHNAVVKLLPQSKYTYTWWPKCVEKNKRPVTHLNYLQLNSIAAGDSLSNSFFSSSTDEMSSRRPGQINFPVDRRGVIFSGKTRQTMCAGLTRPHSARLYQNKIWLDNSGYGEFGYVENNQFRSIIKLPGWTRGLAIHKNIAFVGTSRVIPKFRKYAPGLNLKKSVCGIFAVDLKSSKILGSITWPYGNQIFAIEWLESNFSSGFPYRYPTRNSGTNLKHLFYAFKTKE